MTTLQGNSRVSPISAILITLGLVGFGLFLAYQGAGNQMFMPHAHCYLFNEHLMRLHGWSDLLIGISYVSISATLAYLTMRARHDLPFHWMMLAFAVFIVACGTTHFMEVWTLQSANPAYWTSGWVKVLTAAASLSTAVLLPPLVPKILVLLRSANQASSRQQELEVAYAELSELYRKATQPAPRKERISAILDLRGIRDRPEGIAEIAREVTEHARELERAKHAAEDANRAKDQFLAVLSHELRTPLTPALAAASALETQPAIDAEELRESLALIRRNIELEARLVDDLLDLTRISRGKLQVHLQTVDLHETIRHATEMCRSEANAARSHLVLHLDATSHHVRGDAARLAQVFWNLTLNALKFTPANGNITIRSSNPHSNRVRIEVSDTGIGVPPDKLTRIFEPFQQAEESTTRRFGGLGLGLSVAKGLMDAHGGTITAHSDGLNKGTTFTVDMSTTIPVEQDVTDTTVHPPRSTRPLRVLIVEDHGDTRQALCRIISRWGHQVASAATVAEAVKVAAEYRPELLLSDIGLPDGTGVDLLERLAEYKPLVAIAMSGYGMESDLERTKRAGFKVHLVKPVAAERLKEAIERLAANGSPGA
jgi:signal transduction histidine kinase